MCPQFKSGPRHLREFPLPGSPSTQNDLVRGPPETCLEANSRVPNELAMGDRLMAGLRSLEPSIGVRIPVPQPSSGRDAPVSNLNAAGKRPCRSSTKYGAYSSKAERLIVDQKVAGSSPARRPSGGCVFPLVRGTQPSLFPTIGYRGCDIRSSLVSSVERSRTAFKWQGQG